MPVLASKCQNRYFCVNTPNAYKPIVDFYSKMPNDSNRYFTRWSIDQSQTLVLCSSTNWNFIRLCICLSLMRSMMLCVLFRIYFSSLCRMKQFEKKYILLINHSQESSRKNAYSKIFYPFINWRKSFWIHDFAHVFDLIYAEIKNWF